MSTEIQSRISRDRSLTACHVRNDNEMHHFGKMTLSLLCHSVITSSKEALRMTPFALTDARHNEL